MQTYFDMCSLYYIVKSSLHKWNNFFFIDLFTDFYNSGNLYRLHMILFNLMTRKDFHISSHEWKPQQNMTVDNTQQVKGRYKEHTHLNTTF